MARKTESVAEPPAPQVPLTQRAYTLRVRRAPGTCKTCKKEVCSCWRDALWATHESVNKGAKVFGDWLLTLRGGLSHELANESAFDRESEDGRKQIAAVLKELKKSRSKDEGEPADADAMSEIERRRAVRIHDRRILLALSWLSVEDARSAPNGIVRIATGQEADSVRRDKVLAALRAILTGRAIDNDEIKSWVADCADSLSARIRDDAVWINRSAVFDAARAKIGPSLTRDEVWNILEPFFGSRQAYLVRVELQDDDSGEDEKAKDLVQKAGQWLSSRFGTGRGADFESMAKVYAAMTTWANAAGPFTSGPDALADLANSLSGLNPPSADADGILALISGPGYKSATRNRVKAWGSHGVAVSRDDLTTFAEVTAEDERKCKASAGGKGRRPWSDKILEQVETECGFTYLQQGGPARHSEFAVMLDHAARRVSIGHSWIKRAEAERRRFEDDRGKLERLRSDIRDWLDAFFEERGRTTNAVDGYVVRKRALGGKNSKAWKAVVKAWAACTDEGERRAAVGRVQADWDEDEKFGHSELFEALAGDDAKIVWQDGPEALVNYVASRDAQDKQRRFKVPAYRHPDPLRHPVFGDFGNSRWDIEYAVHEAAKAANKKRAPDAGRSEWLKDQHGLRMGLWDRSTVGGVALCWSSKRLTKDIALNARNGTQPTQDVGRADRLGRAASGVREGKMPTATALFGLDDWNGRLQAPRGQLDAIAKRVEKHGWDAVARKMRDHLQWLVTFSAKLECRGPWYTYFDEQSDKSPFLKVVASGTRKGQKYASVNGWSHSILNDAREGHSKLTLSRLPGLRVLSVDLGHRFAASCAVWEAISAKEMVNACREHGHRKPQESDLFIHLTRTVKKERKKGRDKGKTVDVVETTIYRRIGEDFLRCPKTGKPTTTPHPAPWARLDRQFFIKLQGEERPARAATNGRLKDGSPTETNEVEMAYELSSGLGLRRDDADDAIGRGVDELMRRAMRIATLGLKRHGRIAKIAYAIKPDCPGIPGMGGAIKAITRGDNEHVKFITNALADWHALSTDTEWDGSAARQLWKKHIKPVPGGFEVAEPTRPDPSAERPTRQQRRKSEEELREKLKPIAAYFTKASAECARHVHDDWAKHWADNDGIGRKSLSDPAKSDFAHTLIRDERGRVTGSRTAPKEGKGSPRGWHARLRLLTDWIMGWRLPGAQSTHWNRNVGGLSLTRITTMRSLYQLHKAFAMRPRPHDVRGAPEKGESNAGVAQSILDAMERMREQRVKQIASRIVEAAIGVGVERDRVWDDEKRKWRYPKRPREMLYHLDEKGTERGDPRFKTCHAVVIENMRNYRPDELQTRRENRALMNWSAGKVRKYLEEACQLHGLHLRDVMPNYTSRQCSRTGLPGMRCDEVPIDEFLTAPWWNKTVNAAAKRLQENGSDSLDRLLVALRDKWSKASDSDKARQRTLRLPRAGGDLFVAAPSRERDESTPARAIQADLNAAANIGLRALLDPDFPGRWWYVPCIEDKAAGTAVPRADKVKGSVCFGPDPSKPEQFGSLLNRGAGDSSDGQERPGRRRKARGSNAGGKETTNFWSDPLAAPLRNATTGGFWFPTPAYWRWVRKRVVAALWQANGLGAPPADLVRDGQA